MNAPALLNLEEMTMFSTGIVVVVIILMPVILACTFHALLRISLEIRKPYKGEQT